MTSVLPRPPRVTTSRMAGLAGRTTVALLTLVAALGVHAQDTTGVGAITGVVRGENAAPLQNARVCALGSAACAATDERGRFRIADLRAGTYQLEILPPSGLPFVSEPVEVRAGLEARVDITVPVIDLEQTVTVIAPTFAAPPEVKSSGYLLEPRAVLKSAGALQDVSRYVRSLPGVVVGSQDFRNDLIVRGGSPLENLFIVDNVEIPNINAFANFASAGGTVGILHAELLEDVTFLSGGYPAPYGNRTSSVLQVVQREGSREGVEGRATLSFSGAGAILEGPIGSGRGSWIVSARRSFLDLFSEDIGIGGVPVFYSLNAKAVYDATPRDRLWLVNVSGVDDIRLGLTEDVQPDEELFNFDIRYSGYRSATGFNWQRVLGQRGVGLLGVTHARAGVDSRVRDLVRDGVPPAGVAVDAIIDASPTVFREESTEAETTLKYDLTVSAPFVQRIQGGASFTIFQIDYDTASPFGNDNPYAPAPGLSPFALRTGFRAYQTSAYLQATRQLFPRLNVTLGGRFDDYRYIGRSRWSGRAAASYRLAETLSWHTSYGRYFQQPFFLFLAAFPENRTVIPFRADHYVTGLVWEPGDAWRVTLEAYRKRYADYPVARDVPALSLANLGDTFDVRSILLPLASEGSGQAEGIELFAEKKLTQRVYGQANLALSRTRHAGLDGIRRPGSFDYPVVANLVGGYRLSPRWELSVSLAYLAGRPFTPFDEALSVSQRRGVYDLDRVNGLRAPDYFRLDLRVDRTFALGDRPLVVFAGVQNLTNRRNFAGHRWNRRLNRVDTGGEEGIFPILGLEWRF